jgi:hypothetical protein
MLLPESSGYAVAAALSVSNRRTTKTGIAVLSSSVYAGSEDRKVPLRAVE